jgi:hypothetical protein
MEILEKINAELEAFKAKKADLTKQLQHDFPKLFTPLFEQSKRINSFGWQQYTPYFNDGDECIFRCNSDYLDINGVNEDDADNDDNANFVQKEIWQGKRVPNPNYDANEAEIFEQIKKILKAIPDEFYKELFGDHVEVTVNRDGTIETEEYEHD